MATDGFSATEKAAMKQRAAELRAEAKQQKAAGKAAADLQNVLDAHAAMTETERALAENLHAIVLEHAPHLLPKTWYGFPSYAGPDGKIVVFFQPGGKFGTRYSTVGFQDAATLDAGSLWATSFAYTAVDDGSTAQLVELIERATRGGAATG
jgi:uncharacterized protein YdhG (YjbR/CyaY superfamily)